jgi:hypothetical protein
VGKWVVGANPASKASKAIFDDKILKAKWQVCREISGLSIVCHGSKSLGNTASNY